MYTSRARIALLLLLFAAPTGTARAQPLADTVFTWRGYHRNAHCRLRLYVAPTDDERSRTIVLAELAENRGPSTLRDARLLAELIGRQYGIDPAEAYWVFHWGAFSFADARPAPDKEVFLRATFRHTRSGGLGTPSWRVVTRADVEALTDRQFR